MVFDSRSLCWIVSVDAGKKRLFHSRDHGRFEDFLWYLTFSTGYCIAIRTISSYWSIKTVTRISGTCAIRRTEQYFIEFRNLPWNICSTLQWNWGGIRAHVHSFSYFGALAAFGFSRLLMVDRVVTILQEGLLIWNWYFEWTESIYFPHFALNFSRTTFFIKIYSMRLFEENKLLFIWISIRVRLSILLFIDVQKFGCLAGELVIYAIYFPNNICIPWARFPFPIWLFHYI